MYNKTFLEKLLQKFVVYIFTLLLAHFASKLVNSSHHSESLNIRKNSEIDDILLRRQVIVDFQRLTVPRIIDQLGRKGEQKKREDVSCQLLLEVLKKIFVVCTWTVGAAVKIRSVHMYAWSRVDLCFFEEKITERHSSGIGDVAEDQRCSQIWS